MAVENWTNRTESPSWVVYAIATARASASRHRTVDRTTRGQLLARLAHLAVATVMALVSRVMLIDVA